MSKDMIVVSGAGNVVVEVDGLAKERRDAVVANARAMLGLGDVVDRDLAVERLRELKAIEAATEKSRKEVKAPVLDLGKKVDAVAAMFVVPVRQEIQRLSMLITGWEAEQRRKAAEIERQRQEEARRVEAERLRLEAEARRLEEEKRKAAAAAAEPSMEELIAARRRERELEAERQRLDEEQRKKSAELQIQAAVADPGKAEGVQYREVWEFEVEDVVALWRARPDLVEMKAKRSEVIAALKETGGNLPGVKAKKEMKMAVRS